MSNPFKRPSEFAGGSYFKPAEYMTALALLVEPKKVERDVQSEYKGEVRVRDEVISDVTVFGNSESLETGIPTEVIKDTRVTHGMLTDTLSKIIGDPLIGVIRRIPTKRGSGYAFRDLEDAGQIDQAAAFFFKRNEDKAAALASAPDFD